VFTRDDATTRVVLPNPTSVEYAVLRPSLVPQMVDTLGRNWARQTQEAACFELGRVFGKEVGGALHEEERLAIGMMGPVGRPGPGGKKPVRREEAFLWIKGVVQGLAAAQGLGELRVVPVAAPAFECGWAVTVYAGERVLGTLGLIRDDLRRHWRITEPLAVAELVTAPLYAHALRRPALKPVSVYPAVTRDVALIVDEIVTHEAILATIRKNAPVELTGVTLFDIFRSEGIGVGRKSLAYSLAYRSAERSLTDEEANGFHEAIKRALRSDLKAEIREN
jgi:phenylalanyl-tRNA synthetase beta chain